MMHLRRIALVLLLFVFLLPDANAQVAPEPFEGPEVRLQLHTGLAFPLEPAAYAEFWNVGPTVGAGIGILMTPQLQLSLQGAYHRVGTGEGPYSLQQLDMGELIGEQIGFPPGIQARIDGAQYAMWSLRAEVAFRIPTALPVAPYFVIGPGLYHNEINDGLIDVFGTVVVGNQEIPVEAQFELNERVETSAGVHFGTGLEIRVRDNLDVLVETNYTVVFTPDDNIHFLPTRLGLSYTL